MLLIFNSCKDDKNQKISINSHYWKCLAYYYTLIYSDECPYLGCCRNSASTIVPSSLLQVSPGNFNLNPLFNSCGKSVLILLPMPEDILVNYSYLICLCDVTSLFYWTRVLYIISLYCDYDNQSDGTSLSKSMNHYSNNIFFSFIWKIQAKIASYISKIYY